MNKGTKCILKAVEKIGTSAILFATASASLWFCYQEKEPEGMEKFVKIHKR